MLKITIEKKIKNNFDVIYTACKMIKKNKDTRHDYLKCIKINRNHLYASNGKVLFWIDLENNPEIEEDLPKSFYKVLICNKEKIVLQKIDDINYPDADEVINCYLDEMDKKIPLKGQEELSEFTLLTKIPLSSEFYSMTISTNCSSASFKNKKRPVVFHGKSHKIAIMPMRISPREIVKIKGNEEDSKSIN